MKKIQLLNTLLSDLQMHRQNLHAMHWMINGKKFFELHGIFGDYYNETLLHVDEVAERILQLKGEPVLSFEGYNLISSIERIDLAPNVNKKSFTDEFCITNILLDIDDILDTTQVLLEMTAEEVDEGTFRIMSGITGCYQKRKWMLEQYMGK